MMGLEELEKRIGVLEDIEAIKKLHRKYVFCLSCRAWDDLLDCFAEDATADIWKHGLRRGKKEITELVYNVFDKLEKTPGHLVGQPVISVEGDRARGYWILYLFPHVPQGEPMTWMQGRHDCEYVKIDGEWKFSAVKFTRPWPPEDVTTGRARIGSP
jgi:hypothetical protein